MPDAFDLKEIARIEALCQKRKQLFIPVDGHPFSDEEAYFYFIGDYEGQKAVYNAYLYPLKTEYMSRLMVEAEQRVQEKYPDFEMEGQNWLDESQDNQALELFDEYVDELAEDPGFGVQEFVEIHGEEEGAFGISMDVCRNISEVSKKHIERFIRDFTSGNFALDTTVYSFDLSEEMEED